MRRPASGRAAFWVGSVALHLVFIAVLAVAALRWRSDPPPQELAVEGNVVRYEDLPASVRAGEPLRESRPPAPQVPPPSPIPEPLPPQPEPVEDTAQKQAAAEAQKLEQERIALERRQAEQQRLAAELQRTQEAQAQQLKAAEEKRRAAEAAEAQRQAEQRKQQEALAAKQQQAEREAKARADREADLQRALASEEEGEAFARSGVVDEYRALLVQTIERNWNKPPSARAGLKCMLYVTQASGGTVLDVKIGECNGDQAVRESVANAVYRSSPLPAPRDPRAFQRQLVMNFEPKE